MTIGIVNALKAVEKKTVWDAYSGSFLNSMANKTVLIAVGAPLQINKVKSV